MSGNDSLRTNHMKRILFITLLISLIEIGIWIGLNPPVSSLIVSTQQDPWNLTLQITEPSGIENTVVIGGATNASDVVDDLDLPEPPAPPMSSYIRAYFATPFSIPFNKLLREYKYILSPCMEWNLSILWVSESDNGSPTTISITWDTTQAAQSGFTSFKIYENEIVVANLLTEQSYSFFSTGTLHHYQIIGTQSSTNINTTQSNQEILPMLLGLSIIVIILIVTIFIYNRRG